MRVRELSRRNGPERLKSVRKCERNCENFVGLNKILSVQLKASTPDRKDLFDIGLRPKKRLCSC